MAVHLEGCHQRLKFLYFSWSAFWKRSFSLCRLLEDIVLKFLSSLSMMISLGLGLNTSGLTGNVPATVSETVVSILGKLKV